MLVSHPISERFPREFANRVRLKLSEPLFVAKELPRRLNECPMERKELRRELVSLKREVAHRHSSRNMVLSEIVGDGVMG